MQVGTGGKRQFRDQDEDRTCKMKSYIKYYGENIKMENAIAAENEKL